VWDISFFDGEAQAALRGGIEEVPTSIEKILTAWFEELCRIKSLYAG